MLYLGAHSTQHSLPLSYALCHDALALALSFTIMSDFYDWLASSGPLATPPNRSESPPLDSSRAGSPASAFEDALDELGSLTSLAGPGPLASPLAPALAQPTAEGQSVSIRLSCPHFH